MATANYTAQAAEAGRRVQWLVEIELDRCTLQYTQGACAISDAGDGDRCWYGITNCQIPAAYARGTRIYRFCLADVPWADPDVQVFPLLRRLVAVPQRIESSKLSVFPEQLRLVMSRDQDPPIPDHDKGTGFFNTAGSTPDPGEFWRNLLSRNNNYSGRPVRIYRGFYLEDGFDLADFDQVGPDFKLKAYELRRDEVVLTIESPLRDLDTRQIPCPLSEDNILEESGGIDNSQTTFEVTNASEIPDPATAGPGGGPFVRNKVYLEIESEIMEVSSYNPTTNVVTVVRGAFGTTAVSHAQGLQVFHVVAFGADDGTPGNSLEVLQDLLEWVGVETADIDATTFDNVKTIAWPNLDLRRIIRKPKKVAKLVQQIREIRGIVLYIDTAGKWAAKLFGPSLATDTLDDHVFVLDSVELTEDDEDRVTRVLFFWDPVEDNAFEPEDFQKGVVVVNADLEDEDFFGEIREKVVLDLWADALVPIGQVRNLARRVISRLRFGTRLFTFRLDTRDATGLNVGDSKLVQTFRLTGTDGSELVRPALVMAKREVSRGATEFEAIDTAFSGPYLRMGPDTMAESYDSATEADKAFGYWGDADNRVGARKEIGYILF